MTVQSRGGAGILLGAILLSACLGDPAREADRPYTAGVAEVTTVRAEVDPGPTPAAWLRVEGRLPDACTRLEPARVRWLGRHVDVSLETRRDFGSVCPPEPVPFVRTLSLRLPGAAPGHYVVDVNGVEDTFVVLPGGG